MIRRTTIEIDQDLLDRAKKALGAGTTRATVSEALRLAAESAEDARADRASAQRRYLQQLPSHADLTILASDDMWR
ncbi:MAG: type II toxin-antitoxin system VapB family antitoxin [Candidatus Dormibacteria bacterium]